MRLSGFESSIPRAFASSLVSTNLLSSETTALLRDWSSEKTSLMIVSNLVYSTATKYEIITFVMLITLNGSQCLSAYLKMIWYFLCSLFSKSVLLGLCRFKSSKLSVDKMFETVVHPEPVLPVSPMIMNSSLSSYIVSIGDFGVDFSVTSRVSAVWELVKDSEIVASSGNSVSFDFCVSISLLFCILTPPKNTFSFIINVIIPRHW